MDSFSEGTGHTAAEKPFARRLELLPPPKHTMASVKGAHDDGAGAADRARGDAAPERQVVARALAVAGHIQGAGVQWCCSSRALLATQRWNCELDATLVFFCKTPFWLPRQKWRWPSSTI